MSAAPFVLELFSCSGGMAEGFRRAGLPVSIAFDHDADACASYAANLGHAPVRIDVRDLVRMAREGWHPTREIDLLLADPPCTPWSRAGKRHGTDDDRDMLEDTIELVRLLRPRAYLICNVPGLDDAPNLPTVQRVFGELAREGYCVRDFVRLDAANFGVPQHRIRAFWYGHLGGRCVTWPTRTHGSPAETSRALVFIEGCLLKPWVTCREALGHLAPEDLGSPVRLRWRGCTTAQHGSIADKPSRVVGTSNLSDGNVLVSRETPRSTRASRHPGRKPRASADDEPAHVITTRQNGDGNEPALGVPSSQPGNGGAVIEWPWNRPATTVNGQERLAEPGHHGGSMLSQPNAIKLSEKAAAILQGFPPGWRFVGATKRARWAQIGMAMPPPVAEAVARSILAAMASWTRLVS